MFNGRILLPLSALLGPTVAAVSYVSDNTVTPKDNNANCSCYVVRSGDKGNHPEFYDYYRFYDFRNLQNAFSSPPPAINQSQDPAALPVWQPQVLNSTDWNRDWGIQNWSKPVTDDSPIPMANSPANVYIGSEGNTSYLTLRSTQVGKNRTSAEIENEQKNVYRVSMRMYARVKGDAGAVAGFFTYFDDNNESDIEILTADPKNKIRYTNQPSVDKAGNEILAASLIGSDLPSWDEWRTHRIDWATKHSAWFLDGAQVARNTYGVPRKPSYLVLNMWGDGGVWSGNMTDGGSAEFQIQWIEMAFNTAGPPTGANNKKRALDLTKRRGGCDTMCKIDDVAQKGVPETTEADEGEEEGSGGLSGGSIAGIVIGVVVFVVLLAAAAFFLWHKRKTRLNNAENNRETMKDAPYSQVGERT